MRCLAACLLLLLFHGEPAHALVFCVGTSSQLQNTLATAATNGQDDTIRVVQGRYEIPGDGFVYDSVSPANGDDKSLTIDGGWKVSLGACVRDPDEPVRPFQTILDGHGAGRVLRIATRPNGNVTVRNFTFMDGNAYLSADGARQGGGLQVDVDGDYSAVMRIEQNAFINNTAQYGGGIHAFTDAGNLGRLHVTNNLFWENKATSSAAAGLGMTGGRIYLVSNTVSDNRAGPVAVGGIYLGPTDMFIANNNLWGNDGMDLYFRGPHLITGTVLFNNNIGVLGSIPEIEVGTISVEPQYERGGVNFTPARGSPLIDAGIQPPPVTIWHLSETDLNGRPRVMGSGVDIGAYESEYMFTDGFEPAD